MTDVIGYVERVRGVEPLSTGWKPVVMPLYDTRFRLAWEGIFLTLPPIFAFFNLIF
jgi:hypothetical protein